MTLDRHHQPDVVLLDLTVAGVSGLEALPLIRTAARVVVLSALDPADVADIG